MTAERFGVVRLGKDSVAAIKEIDAIHLLSTTNLEVELTCSQVPYELEIGAILFIWLGSDNSKGNETPWEKGLRAIGVLKEKCGGPSYKDIWKIKIELSLIFPKSLSHRDYLRFGAVYEAFSDIPVLGLNTYSNQLAQYISPSPRRDIRALLFCLSSLVPNLKKHLINLFPHLEMLFDYSPDINYERDQEDLKNKDEEIYFILDNKELENQDIQIINTTHPYPIDSVFVRSEPRTVFEVLRRISNGTYIMNPDFQRDYVWDEKKQSKFIESVLMRIPLPAFYFSEKLDGKVVIVDGLQRLRTFQRFVNNEFKLENLIGIDKQYNNAKFSDLPAIFQTRIEDASLNLYLIDAKVSERARLDIFERVNSGVPLTRQQMRNAIYNGVATAFLKEAAQDSDFIMATGGSLDTVKIKNSMRDREIINRFCSFLLLGPDEYYGDLDEFLGKALEKMNANGKSGIEALNLRFKRAMRNSYTVFERQAFRKHTSPFQARSIINVALFEVISVALADVEEKLAKEKKIRIREAFYTLIENEEFRIAISLGTADISRVRNRFRLGLQEIKGAIYD